MAELDTSYDPKKHEEHIYKKWMDSGYFNPDKLAGDRKKTYTIFLPPPNVTGSLHMGHALNATVSDILIRRARMKGYKALWVPGTDHAGIATQNVVEKMLRKEGSSRFQIGREKFLEKVWEWKEQYGNTIFSQLKRIGASLDWSRARFTMDKEYVAEVQKVFVHYYEKGWIFRGERVVNWCPRCGTSLSDIEVEHREDASKLYYISYKVKGEKGEVVVATTRPETLLGDTGVAVNPKDARYKKFVGKHLVVPIVNREVPVVADQKIDAKFGTGAVKVTPAHDMLDYEIAGRHNLPMIQVVGERAKMTAEAGADFAGLSVLEAREKVIAELEKLGALVKTEPYTHSVNICYRCSSIIEPIPSKQWFLKMEKLAEMAKKPVTAKKITILPKNFEKPYLEWLKNVKDWCISRQIWWGHQLPVWFCKKQRGHEGHADQFIVSIEKPKACPFCNECELEQSTDVLDTWFSSALWPFATLNERDQKMFYPSQVLITARDIINFWVARMVFSGMEFMKQIPFSTVFIHGTILTKDGRRMSKSLGTGIDPMHYVDQFGADATRFGIVWQAMGTQDIRWDEAAIFAGKKFANKIWNASRFVMMRNLPKMNEADLKIPKKNLTKADKAILTKLAKTVKSVDKDLDALQFGKALHTAYDFFWHEFCDVYLEEAKNQDSPESKLVLLYTLLASLKLLHPFMPFVTETIYSHLPLTHTKGLLLVESWPA
jgi:valyl-tRNA synthetase